MGQAIEMPYLLTQVSQLDQMEASILDAASMLEDQPPEGFEVEVVSVMAADDVEMVTEAPANLADLLGMPDDGIESAPERLGLRARDAEL
jgi:hypothetical protein